MTSRAAIVSAISCCLLGACDVEEVPVVGVAPAYTRPADVKSLFSRASNCQHWAGEEAYDAARGKQILQAVHRLRCEQLDDQYAALRRKYANDAAVSQDMEDTSITNDFEFSYHENKPALLVAAPDDVHPFVDTTLPQSSMD